MDNIISLDQAELGKKYNVVDIKASINIKRRLLDFGFVNTTITLVNTSTLKGVYLLQIRNYLIALRKSEVKSIMVVKVWIIVYV